MLKLAQKTQQQAPKLPLKKPLMMPWTLLKVLRTPWVKQRSKQPKTLLLPLEKLLTPLKKLLKPLKKKLSKLF